LSSSFAVCSCGNNNLSLQHDEEKMSAEDRANLVAEKLTRFGHLDENTIAGIQNFFPFNAEYFQDEHVLVQFFDYVGDDIERLYRVLNGTDRIEDLDCFSAQRDKACKCRYGKGREARRAKELISEL
jgi:hypothetical protein